MLSIKCLILITGLLHVQMSQKQGRISFLGPTSILYYLCLRQQQQKHLERLLVPNLSILAYFDPSYT